ncbi:MAG TPA: hypothetical protein VHL59_03435, partial [Thermoanaerobaculia bacterium]|nr:hypothetical protein [Thermoanaerobaculia bacterium]
WRTSGSACVAEISRNAASLFLSPPTEEATEPFRDRHRAKLQMIKCHGAQLDPHFYGQQGEHFPPVLLSSSLIGRTEPGTVVGAMCCYGAAVYDPTDPAAIRPGTPAIANVYLSQSAAGFAGSTSIAWVGINDMACADLIICRFLKNVMTGVSLGAALLDSKQRFLAHINKDGRMPDAAEEKTLLQFLLLGDPSLRPVKSREERDERQPIVAAAGSFVRREQHGQYDDSGKGHLLSVKRVSPSAAAERRSRRHYHSGMARQLREQLPDRVAAEPPFTAEQILNADELAYLGARKPVVHRVSRQRVQPEIARRKRLTRAAAAALTVNADAVETVSHVLREETLQYYWFARTEREHVVDATVVKVETDLHGNVLRKQVLVTA